MDIVQLGRALSGWTKNNSPLVLTGIAVGGVITTAVLAFKAGEQLTYSLENQRTRKDFGPVDGRGEPLTAKEIWIENWPIFIPPVCSAGLTIAAILASYKVSARKQAAVAGALAISEKALHEYREKVAEVISKRKAEQIHEEVIQDQVKKTPPWDSEIVKTGNGNNRCFDTYTGRYFMSTRQGIDNAVNMLNNQLNNHEYGSLNDFYGFIGLGPTAAGDDLGWNSSKLLEVSYSSHLAEDGDPCLALYFQTRPIPDFYRVY